MPKSQYLSRSLETKLIWTFDTIFNERCTYDILLLSLQLNTDNSVTTALVDRPGARFTKVRTNSFRSTNSLRAQ